MYNNNEHPNHHRAKPVRKLYATIIQVDKQGRRGLNMIPFLVRTGMMVQMENKN